MNIYRYDDDGPKTDSHAIDTIREFERLDADPDKRDELIALAFGNYIVTLGREKTVRTGWIFTYSYTFKKKNFSRRQWSCL